MKIMKKMKKILFIFVAFFGLLTIAMAEEKEWIIYDWSINQGETSNYLYYDETIEDEDGYVTISIDENIMGIMRKITKDGKEIIWEKKSDLGMHLSLRQDENYYYTVTFDYSYYNFGDTYLIRYTKDGEIDDRIQLADSSEYMSSGAEIYVTDGKLNIMIAGGESSTGFYGPLRVYTVTSTEEEFVIETTENYSNLSTEELSELTGDRNIMFDGNWSDLIPEEFDDYIVSNQYSDDEYIYAVGDIIQDEKTYGFIIKVDKNKNVIWFKKSEENTHYFDVTSSSKNFTLVISYKDEDNTPIGYPRNQDNVESQILVYDQDGNIVETHNIAEEIGTEAADATHFLPFGDCIIAHAFAYDETDTLSSYVIRYTVNYQINTIVNGEGSIDVIEKSKSGDNITFKVTPKEGYILSEVKVTDANGNVIKFKDYTFTMPSADVTIEAIFVEDKNNPNTTDVAVIACMAIIVLGGIGTAYSIRKLSWLK